jgi:hypothetical protein
MTKSVDNVPSWRPIASSENLPEGEIHAAVFDDKRIAV